MAWVDIIGRDWGRVQEYQGRGEYDRDRRRRERELARQRRQRWLEQQQQWQQWQQWQLWQQQQQQSPWAAPQVSGRLPPWERSRGYLHGGRVHYLWR